MATPKSKPAKHGDKMIEIKIRFWTNDMATKEGEIIPKHAWSSGMVSIEKNRSHKIEAQKPKAFRSLMALPGGIEDVLIARREAAQEPPLGKISGMRLKNEPIQSLELTTMLGTSAAEQSLVLAAVVAHL